MENNKVKITVEIPIYLKNWIDKHDLSQNALVVAGLRKQYLEEQQVPTAIIQQVITEAFENYKLIF